MQERMVCVSVFAWLCVAEDVVTVFVSVRECVGGSIMIVFVFVIMNVCKS